MPPVTPTNCIHRDAHSQLQSRLCRRTDVVRSLQGTAALKDFVLWNSSPEAASLNAPVPTGTFAANPAAKACKLTFTTTGPNELDWAKLDADNKVVSAMPGTNTAGTKAAANANGDLKQKVLAVCAAVPEVSSPNFAALDCGVHSQLCRVMRTQVCESKAMQ
jgi:hypothetical protein